MDRRTASLIRNLDRHLSNKKRVKAAPEILARLSPVVLGFWRRYMAWTAETWTGGAYWYYKRHVRCGKPSCRTCRQGDGHGPYWFAIRRADGRRIYLGRTFSRLPDDTETLEPPRMVSCPMCGEPRTVEKNPKDT
jgi:hypothetical protein